MFKAFEKKDNSNGGKNRINLVFTNEHMKTCGLLVCSKEKMCLAYIEKVGKNIDFNGTNFKVVSVKVTEDFINIELEEPV